MWPRHAGVCDRGGSARLHARVIRLDVCVRSDDRGHLAVEPPCHRHLLTRRFGVHVDDDHGRAHACFVDQVVDHFERADRWTDEERADEVRHRNFGPVCRRHEGQPSSRCAPGEVRRSDHALALLQVGNDLAAAPDVVAERDRIDAGGQHLVRELRRDPHAVREILAVQDAEVDVQLLPQRGQSFLDRPPAGPADDVGDKQNPQSALPPTRAKRRVKPDPRKMRSIFRA